MSMVHARAQQPEIIRCVQKDALYVNSVRELLELSQTLFSGSSVNQQWRLYYHRVSGIAAPLAYFGYHSLLQLQTLGEEYTGIIQMNRSFTQLPNRALQLINYVMEYSGDAILKRLLSSIDNSIQSDDDIRDEAKEKLTDLISSFKSAIPYLKVAHLGWFYMQGKKYQISKRITGLNYVLYSHLDRPNGYLSSYRWLGIITFLQLFIVLFGKLKLSRKIDRQHALVTINRQQSEEGAIEDTFDADKCNLCLEARRKTSATPCGHLFCWDCIMNCLQSREECPICREVVKKPNVVFLMNYV